MDALLTTLLHRPYVFIFLISFLVIGFLNRGLARTLLFLVLGFSIALASEISSIRNGFPYGFYSYIYENMPGEMFIAGVPVWDSLSYSFLAFAAYEVAYYFFPSWARGIKWMGAALLMVMLDMAADPVAVRGERWFLGKIFFYPDGGPYFGVPLSNFAGWLLVASLIFIYYTRIVRHFQTPPPLRFPRLGVFFYLGILAFNLSVTFWIGETALGLLTLGMHATAFALLALVKKWD